MKTRRPHLTAALAALALMLAACVILPEALFSFRRPTPQPAIPLKRCDEVEDVLCLITFGIQPPDQMIIVLLTTPGLPEDLEVFVTHGDERHNYACAAVELSPTVVYCAGPQLPLGARVQIDVQAVSERTLLASGEFVLTAFAVPTVLMGGVELPTLVFPTARPTRTPPSGTGYPNPIPGATSTPRPGVTSNPS
jgi:hypothetical protein